MSASRACSNGQVRAQRRPVHPTVRPDTRRRSTLVLLLIAVLAAAGLAAPAEAAPRVAPEFDFTRYSPVNSDRYRSIAFQDNGRYFFRVGKRICQMTGPSSVGCSGGAATAPRGVKGVTISGDMQGPQWVPPGTTYRFGSRVGFRAPVLSVGKRIRVWNITCAVPRANVVSCTTPNRAFAISPAWHRFVYPKGDRAHSKNPKAKYLPAHLR